MSMIEREIQTALIGIISGLKHAMRYSMQKHSIPLTSLHFITLKMIHDYECCTPLLIAEKSGRDKGQITRLLQELEKQSLIEKKINESDRRSFFLSLTNQGVNYFKVLENEDLKALEEMTKDISEEHLKLFLEIAQQMAINLENLHRDHA